MSLNEESENIKERISTPSMIEINESGGGFVIQMVFILILFGIGIFFNIIENIQDYNKALIITGVLYILLMLGLKSSLNNKKKLIDLLYTGIVTEAEIIKKEEIRSRSHHNRAHYHYRCNFTSEKNREEKSVNIVRFMQYFDYGLQVGDFIKIRYNPENPKECFREPSEKELKAFLSKKAYVFSVLLSIFIVGIVVSGLTYRIYGISEMNNFFKVFIEEISVHKIERMRYEILLLIGSILTLIFSIYVLFSSTVRESRKYMKLYN